MILSIALCIPIGPQFLCHQRAQISVCTYTTKQNFPEAKFETVLGREHLVKVSKKFIIQ